MRRAQARRRNRRLIADAKKLYVWLLAELGGVCARCGATAADCALTVDHPNGRQWDKPAREYRYDVRVRRYVEEYMAGVPLRCLCFDCNSSHVAESDLPEAPF